MSSEEATLVPVVEEEVFDVPEHFYECKELPASPHSYLGYFDVNVVNFKTGATLFNVKLEAPRYNNVAPPFTLEEIRTIIEKEMQMRQLNLLHVLFYDDAYKSFSYLSERKVVQCTSFIFRVLVEVPPVAGLALEQPNQSIESVCQKKVLPYGIQPQPLTARVKKAMESTVSNPSFPDRKPGQSPYVSLRDLRQRAEVQVNNLLLEQDGVTDVEEKKRLEITQERSICDATLRAARVDAWREKELLKQRETRELEMRKEDKIVHDRQKQLMAELREYMGSVKAIEDNPDYAPAAIAANEDN